MPSVKCSWPALLLWPNVRAEEAALCCSLFFFFFFVQSYLLALHKCKADSGSSYEELGMCEVVVYPRTTSPF